MKRIIITLTTVFTLMVMNTLYAQDEETTEKKPARPAFESQLLIDNQTVVIPTKGTLEWDMQHRFGVVEDGIKDLFGLYDPSNIRMGFTYSILERLNLGYGFTKFDRYHDFNIKYLILQQTRDNSMPVSIAYYGVAAINASDEAQEYGGFIEQVSYFNELLIARRFGPNLSLQVAPVHSHFNSVDRKGADSERYDMFGLAVGGRYKIGGTMSAIFDVTQPFTEHPGDVPNEPNISFGIEISTSSHAFQVFAGNYQSLIPQQNLAYNPNGFDAQGILIGFNITRLWNF
jgi:hypothetical protein